MKKRRMLILLSIVALAAVLLISLSTAFLTDVEVKENNITIGKISVELDEGDFDPSEPHDVVPGSRVKKAPSLKNSGNKDEFVFMKITIPKDSVTLLYEADDGVHSKGTPIGDRRLQQLFRMIAKIPDSPAVNNVDTVTTTVSGKDVDFSYHSDKAGADDAPGWMLLTKDESDSAYDEYVFGYNQKLLPDDQTVTIFDEVQLKSFIDGETSGSKDIGITAYAIQADYLKPSGSVDMTAEYLSEDTLRAIYTIVQNKANG